MFLIGLFLTVSFNLFLFLLNLILLSHLIFPSLLVLKRRTDAEPNARKTDGMDGSELRNTLKGMEHGKEAEKRNV